MYKDICNYYVHFYITIHDKFKTIYLYNENELVTYSKTIKPVKIQAIKLS